MHHHHATDFWPSRGLRRQRCTSHFGGCDVNFMWRHRLQGIRAPVQTFWWTTCGRNCGSDEPPMHGGGRICGCSPALATPGGTLWSRSTLFPCFRRVSRSTSGRQVLKPVHTLYNVYPPSGAPAPSIPFAIKLSHLRPQLRAHFASLWQTDEEESRRL